MGLGHQITVSEIPLWKIYVKFILFYNYNLCVCVCCNSILLCSYSSCPRTYYADQTDGELRELHNCIPLSPSSGNKGMCYTLTDSFCCNHFFFCVLAKDGNSVSLPLTSKSSHPNPFPHFLFREVAQVI